MGCSVHTSLDIHHLFSLPSPPSFPHMQMALFSKPDRCWQVYCSQHHQTARGCLSQMIFFPLITWRIFFLKRQKKNRPFLMPLFYLKETECHLSSSLAQSQMKGALNKDQPALKQSFVTGGWGELAWALGTISRDWWLTGRGKQGWVDLNHGQEERHSHPQRQGSRRPCGAGCLPEPGHEPG